MDAGALGKGLRKRCPVCGEKDIFDGFFTISERCPTCGLVFEREDGYWLGAMVVAMALVIVAFTVVFLGGIALTWPDPPWTTLLVATVGVNLIVPIALYPWCMTVWMGLHHAVVTSNRDEGAQPRH
ncbi:MAG: DUF983 domain-containing protein [Nitriliruptor sp.]